MLSLKYQNLFLLRFTGTNTPKNKIEERSTVVQFSMSLYSSIRLIQKIILHLSYKFHNAAKRVEAFL